MKEIILTSIILIISIVTSAEILKFKGVILQKKNFTIAKYYTKINNKDYCTTIKYFGTTRDKNKNLKHSFQITENQNNKELKTYKILLDHKDILTINNTKFKFLLFRGELVFLKIEEKEKYAKLP